MYSTLKIRRLVVFLSLFFLPIYFLSTYLSLSLPFATQNNFKSKLHGVHTLSVVAFILAYQLRPQRPLLSTKSWEQIQITILVLKRKSLTLILDGYFIWREEIPFPKIFQSLPCTYKMLHVKEEPQRLSGQRDPSLQTNNLCWIVLTPNLREICRDSTCRSSDLIPSAKTMIYFHIQFQLRCYSIARLCPYMLCIRPSSLQP